MNPSYLSPVEYDSTDADTSRSDTPNIKLPLQMMEPAVFRRSPDMRGTTSNTNRSWLENPDRDSRSSVGLGLDSDRGDVQLDDMRGMRDKHKAQMVAPQQASQVTITSPNPTSPALTSPGTGPLQTIGDEESRPGSRSSRESEWNSTHPCYPHRNPYVPLDSQLYESTRIIRISRDFMVYGDLSPAYSNVFPDILEPHITEEQFRVVVAKVNEDLKEAFDPWNMWNWVDAVVGLLTLWLMEEVVDTHCKRMLRRVEGYLEWWNRELEERGQKAVFVSLRRTGYMNLDIQIPDPIPAISEEDETESKFVDEDGNSETGSVVGPLGSEAGHHSLRMNSMSGRVGSNGRIGSLGSGDYSSEGGYR